MRGYSNAPWPYLMTADQLRGLKRRDVATSNDRVQGWCKAPWIPMSPEMAADILGKPVDEVRATFGDTVMYRYTLTAIEFKPGPLSETEMRASVSRILVGALGE